MDRWTDEWTNEWTDGPMNLRGEWMALREGYVKIWYLPYGIEAYNVWVFTLDEREEQLRQQDDRRSQNPPRRRRDVAADATLVSASGGRFCTVSESGGVGREGCGG